MTSKQIYDAVNTEMNKVEAPSMLLEDFNYFINKAIYQYINKKYNIYKFYTTYSNYPNIFYLLKS